MAELRIDDEIVIDEIQNVLIEIKKLSGRSVSDYGVIEKFIKSECATRFYIDKKFNSFMANDPSAVYLLLDTGFTTFDGEAIFISLRRYGSTYKGHITGTARALATKMKESGDRKSRSYIESNYSKFKNKYNTKIQDRNNRHIGDDINEFYVSVSNKESAGFNTPFAAIDFSGFVFEEPVEEIEEIAEVVEADEETYDFSIEEEEITIGLLLEKLDKMTEYITELQSTIENLTKQQKLSDDKISTLEQKKKEYEESLVMIRQFKLEEQNKTSVENGNNPSKRGHNLLNGKGQILVLGACGLGDDKMQAIARDYYGFDKKDFIFETDYENSVSVAGRVLNGGRFRIIILGAMPHSVKGRGAESSFVETLKKNDNIDIVIDGRSKSGKLKITKESFKEALSSICNQLEQDQ